MKKFIFCLETSLGLSVIEDKKTDKKIQIQTPNITIIRRNAYRTKRAQ